MYRRPKSLEVLLDIRASMSEECGHDIMVFVEMVRTGARPINAARTVTRVEGEFPVDLQPEVVPQPERIHAADE